MERLTLKNLLPIFDSFDVALFGGHWIPSYIIFKKWNTDLEHTLKEKEL